LTTISIRFTIEQRPLEEKFMETTAIIKEINNLPTHKRMFIVEQVVHSIRFNHEEMSMKEAADSLYDDYKNDRSLTEFTQLDCENFYEAR
jgi:hypothetical protein